MATIWPFDVTVNSWFEGDPRRAKTLSDHDYLGKTARKNNSKLVYKYKSKMVAVCKFTMRSYVDFEK